MVIACEIEQMDPRHKAEGDDLGVMGEGSAYRPFCFRQASKSTLVCGSVAG